MDPVKQVSNSRRRLPCSGNDNHPPQTKTGRESNRTALAVGTLMNARGLMELIILNIGLQKGIIQPALFSIMVIMAIVTTLIASPIFELVYRKKPTTETDPDPAPANA
jgi:Kef-type K+ transport system membrane component KefB